jgi:hypothetical protein
MSSDLIARLPEWEAEADQHDQKARALRQLIDAVRILNGDAERLLTLSPNGDSPPEGFPRGREAVRRITRERPGIWRVRDIKAEVVKRGWPSSASAIETAVKRLQIDGEAEWIKKGHYRFGGEVEPVFDPTLGTESEATEEVRTAA